MVDLHNQLGVQSWCFRNFKTAPALIEQVQRIGLRHVELCAVHADFANESSFEPLLAQYRAANVQITSIGVQTFKGDAAAEEKWFRFCKLAGATMISATFDIATVPHAYKTAEALAEKYDLLLAIHNHGGYDWLGNAVTLQHTFNHTGERVGLCLDSAWCLQAGENPLEWCTRFRNRLFATHIKDFTFLPTGKPEDVVVGTGNLKLQEYLSLIAAAPILKTITLEYEGDVDNPGPKLKDCVARVRQAATN